MESLFFNQSLSFLALPPNLACVVRQMGIWVFHSYGTHISYIAMLISLDQDTVPVMDTMTLFEEKPNGFFDSSNVVSKLRRSPITKYDLS